MWECGIEIVNDNVIMTNFSDQPSEQKKEHYDHGRWKSTIEQEEKGEQADADLEPEHQLRIGIEILHHIGTAGDHDADHHGVDTFQCTVNRCIFFQVGPDGEKEEHEQGAG